MASSFNGVDLPFLNRIHSTVLAALLPVEGEGEISRDRRLHALFNDLTCRIDSEVRRTTLLLPLLLVNITPPHLLSHSPMLPTNEQ